MDSTSRFSKSKIHSVNFKSRKYATLNVEVQIAEDMLEAGTNLIVGENWKNLDYRFSVELSSRSYRIIGAKHILAMVNVFDSTLLEHEDLEEDFPSDHWMIGHHIRKCCDKVVGLMKGDLFREENATPDKFL